MIFSCPNFKMMTIGKFETFTSSFNFLSILYRANWCMNDTISLVHEKMVPPNRFLTYHLSRSTHNTICIELRSCHFEEIVSKR